MDWQKLFRIILIFLILTVNVFAQDANQAKTKDPSQSPEGNKASDKNFVVTVINAKDQEIKDPSQSPEGNSASEQNQSYQQLGEIFPWYSGKHEDRDKGILIALSGLMGALVTIYTLIGAVMPGTSGGVSLDAEGIRLEMFKKKLSKLWEKESNEINIKAAKELEVTTNNLQAWISRERWRQFGLAALLYLILGAFFAALLTESFLQGLVIGAGWTAYLGVVGLKKDGEVRGSIKDREINDLVSTVDEKEKHIKILKTTLEETKESIEVLSKKRKLLYAPRGINEKRYRLLEGTEKKGPWYPLGQFDEAILKRWELEEKIKYTEI